MHDVKNKFIIINDEIILSRVIYHKDLLADSDLKDMVKGGGEFEYSLSKKTVTFYGRSHDFGVASLDDINNCIKNDKLYTDKFRIGNNFKCFSFFYKNQIGEIISLN
jgi:hypothetical protein